MYDLKALRENLDDIRTALGRRGNDVPWADLQQLSEERRAATTQVEQFRFELNKGSEEVARLRRAKEPADAAMAAMKQLGDRIKDAEGALRKVEEALTDVALRIPNLPHASVPVGADA
ncbi:MAG: serine--tRNA ligase, partial [Nitrospirota bacterium]